MVSFGPENIWNAIQQHYLDPLQPDERYRRLITLRPFVMQAHDWRTTQVGDDTYVLTRERPVRRAHTLRQRVTIDVVQGEVVRQDLLEGIGVNQMPRRIRRLVDYNGPHSFELKTRVRGEQGNESSITELTQHVLWRDERGHSLRQYGGSLFVHDVPTHERGGGMIRTWLDIGVTTSDRFSSEGFVMDHLSLGVRSLGENRIGLQQERLLPLGLLLRFRDIYGKSLLGERLDVMANLLRGWIHGAINAPDIPDHPALRAF